MHLDGNSSQAEKRIFWISSRTGPTRREIEEGPTQLEMELVRQETMQTVQPDFTLDKDPARMSRLPQGMISASFNAGQAFLLIRDTFLFTFESPSNEKHL